MDRWETGDEEVLEIADQALWLEGLQVEEDAEATAASLLPDVRRLCRLCVGDGNDTRLWSMVLASLAPRKDPDARRGARIEVFDAFIDSSAFQDGSSCQLLGLDFDLRLPSLLQLMVLQSASDEIPLQEERKSRETYLPVLAMNMDQKRSLFAVRLPFYDYFMMLNKS